MFKILTSTSARMINKLIDLRPITTRISADGKDVPKKKVYENRVTLIGSDNSITITDIKNAQSLAARRELKLVKIQDVEAKTRRPVYKLMTNAEYHEEELLRRKEKQKEKNDKLAKGDKLVTLSSRIAEHDVMTRVKKIGKLLEKQYEVRVVISGEENEESSKAERLYSIIESNIKTSGKIVQKRIKGSTMKFQILPLKEENDENQNKSDSQNDNPKGPL